VAGRLEIADQREGDLPVGPDLDRLRELRILVDLDAELVAGAEAVLVAQRRPLRRRLLVGIRVLVLVLGRDGSEGAHGERERRCESRDDVSVFHGMQPQF
jgi:hypothetical protein